MDAARGFAIFAMIVAHTYIFISPAHILVAYSEGTLNHLAAPLFALIIGVTIAVTGPQVRENSADRFAQRSFLVQTGLRAVLLIGIGFLLQYLPTNVNIVLEYLGVAMLCTLPFLFLGVRALLIWASSLVLLVPGVITFLRDGTVGGVPQFMFELPLPFRYLLDWLLLGYAYQALSFLPLILIGIVLGRGAMRNRRTMVTVLATGVIMYLPLEAWKVVSFSDGFVRGGYLEVWRELPLALACFAAIVLVADLLSANTSRIWRVVLQPFAVQGRMALSIYVLHLILLALVLSGPFSGAASALPGWVKQIGIIIACWGFAALWWRCCGAGPVERIVAVFSGRRSIRNLFAR